MTNTASPYGVFPNLRPGDRVSVKHGDTIYTDTVESVHGSGPQAAIWPTLMWWQQVVRRLTPKSRRKPLKPIREAKPYSVDIRVGTAGDDMLERHRKNIAQIQAMMGGITRQ